jgi:hypothetical protein
MYFDARLQMGGYDFGAQRQQANKLKKRNSQASKREENGAVVLPVPNKCSGSPLSEWREKS